MKTTVPEAINLTFQKLGYAGTGLINFVYTYIDIYSLLLYTILLFKIKCFTSW
jgi:hypothetical protein